MEIKINIPKNEYVQPTDVRQEVVQNICEIILKKYMDVEGWWKDIAVYDSCPQVWVRNGEKPRLYTSSVLDEERDTRVRTSEMNAVFDAIQDAGYFIYAVYNITDRAHRYHFSVKPYFDGRKAERIHFTTFID